MVERAGKTGISEESALQLCLKDTGTKKKKKDCETRSVRGDGLYQISWHSWKRQKVLLDCKPFSRLLTCLQVYPHAAGGNISSSCRLHIRDLNGCHF